VFPVPESVTVIKKAVLATSVIPLAIADIKFAPVVAVPLAPTEIAVCKPEPVTDVSVTPRLKMSPEATDTVSIPAAANVVAVVVVTPDSPVAKTKVSAPDPPFKYRCLVHL